MKKSIILITATIIGLSSFSAIALNTNVQTVSAHPGYNSQYWFSTAHRYGRWVITKRNIKATLISGHFLTTRHWKIKTKTIPKGTKMYIGRGGSDYCPWYFANKIKGIGNPQKEKRGTWTIRYHNTNWFLTPSEWEKAHKEVKKINKPAKNRINNRDTSFNQTDTGGALITKNFSVFLNTNDVSVTNGILKINFDFANLKHRIISSNEIENDFNSCVSVYQNNQYLNSTFSTSTVSSLAPKKPMKIMFESSQLQNTTDPVKVVFSNPKNGKQLKIVRINLSKTQTDQNDSF